MIDSFVLNTISTLYSSLTMILLFSRSLVKELMWNQKKESHFFVKRLQTLELFRGVGYSIVSLVLLSYMVPKLDCSCMRLLTSCVQLFLPKSAHPALESDKLL